MVESLVRRILYWAKETPRKQAVAFKTETLSYSELSARIVCAANRLLEIGIKKGDRVLLLAVSKPEMVVAYLAIQYIGAVTVFMDKDLSGERVIELYNYAKAELVLTDKCLAEIEGSCHIYSLRQLYMEDNVNTISVYSEPSPDELAEIIYTSGTTGKQKGCMLSYKAVSNIWMNTINGIGMKKSDVVLIPLPLNHSFALRVLRGTLYLGATVVLQNGFTFAKQIEDNIERYHCNALIMVPASVETIMKQMQDQFARIMGSFRYIEVGAGALSVDQRKKLVEMLPHTQIYNTWGSSESGGVIFYNVTAAIKSNIERCFSALGKPIEGVEIVTIDSYGEVCNGNEQNPGRMGLRGNNLMLGYYNDPELTKTAFLDGYLLTNDLVYRDDDGLLHMLGRTDDIINVGGEKVSPIEIENVFSEYIGIDECACIGVVDKEGILGNVPILYYTSSESKIDDNELRQFASSKLERFKIPSRYIKIDKLPRNSMFKIDKGALRSRWNMECDT